MFDMQSSINCRGHLLELSRPIVMGILNITPDSFYDGGRYLKIERILSRVTELIEEGASIIDIGAASSRPGSEMIDPDTEWERLEEPLMQIKQQFPDTILSLDTYNSTTARRGLEAGVHIINDISAGTWDNEMYQVVGSYRAPYVIMHMQGIPETMQRDPNYEDVAVEVLDFFIGKIETLRRHGIHDIIVDPGFGFGKSLSHNFELLRKMHIFQILDLPILAGISRKSMICKTLSVDPKDALNGTTALNMIALEEGARILRVHDAKEALETIKLWESLNG